MFVSSSPAVSLVKEYRPCTFRGREGWPSTPLFPRPKKEALVYCNESLVSGRLDALVGNLVPTADCYPDRAFLFAFLLASRLFIKPHDLLGQISSRCQVQMQDSHKGKEPSPHLVRLISEWSETFPYDFRDERVMSHVRKVAHRCVSAEEDNNTGGGRSARGDLPGAAHAAGEADPAGTVRGLPSLYTLRFHHVQRVCFKPEHTYPAYESMVWLHANRWRDLRTQLILFGLKHGPFISNSRTNPVWDLPITETDELCGSAECMAQQLTHIELERLSYIGAEEFVQTFAIQTPLLDPSYKDPRITTNYEVYLEWSTRLKRLVITDIVRHIKSKKQRVRIVEYWVDTAKECFNIGNFNSLMAIIAGLNTVPVSRLKRT
ncbi:unnamed protein product, partial [Nesidiocoris tenuis]